MRRMEVKGAISGTRLSRAFTPAHLAQDFEAIEVGSPLLVVGFPLGFHDSLHRLPIVRQAVIASSFGLRFQGQGYFLTDARTHRGTSGAPVVMRRPAEPGATADLPWLLLGVHCAARRRHPRPGTRRSPRPQLRLVRRHPDGAQRRPAGIGPRACREVGLGWRAPCGAFHVATADQPEGRRTPRSSGPEHGDGWGKAPHFF